MVTREEKVKALREYCHSTCDGPFEIDFSFMNDDALNEYYEAEFKEKQKGNKKMIRRKVGTNFLHTRAAILILSSIFQKMDTMLIMK